MKKNLILALGLCSFVLFTSCKSRESAYKQAYEQAMAQSDNKTNEQQVVIEETETQTTTVTPVQPTTTTTVTEDHSDVREIQGEMSVISGNPLKLYLSLIHI